MYVVKRNGIRQQISFDKVTKRISNLVNELNIIDVEATKVAQATISRMYNGMTTKEIDELSAKICASFAADNPEYSNLGGAICISNLQKNTKSNFCQVVDLLWNHVDENGKSQPIVNKDLLHVMKGHRKEINDKIDYSRDFKIDYFGFKTMEKIYLLRIKMPGKEDIIVERPQHMFMRVALAIHGSDLERAFETYDYMSNLKFTHASPTLFNAGTPNFQFSSCFLLGTSDSIGGIYKTLGDCAEISKRGGGIGVHVSNIRSKDSIIRGTNGKSDGIIPMLKVYNATCRYVNQSGRRKGAIAVYLEPWHADVEDFLDLRKQQGPEEKRARDLFLALWIPDLFMERVEKDEMWSLMCPDVCKGLQDVYADEFNKLYTEYESSGMYKKQVKARDLWNHILTTQIEAGVPYIAYKDHANRKTNQKNIGTIKSSNLCIEIMEVSNDKEYSVCNLNSIAVNRFIKYPVFSSIFRLVTKPNCKYCKMAKYKLNKLGYKFEVIELEGEELKGKLNELSNKYNKSDVLTKVPQIELGNELIGGFEELQKYIKPRYDFKELRKVASISTRNINKIINSSLHPVHETLVSDMENRPIGVGIQGLADTFAELGFSFESNEAKVINQLIFETIYYGCVEESINLAIEHEKELDELSKNPNKDLKKEIIQNYTNESHLNKQLSKKRYRGAYPRFLGSPASEGKLQFDLWGYKAEYDSKLLNDDILSIVTKYKFNDKKFQALWDWNSLKKKLKKYGMRNSLLTALMPTASTSQLLGNNECFEPFTSNIYRRDTIAGSFVCINKHLVRDLKLVDKWNSKVKENLIANNGSVQGITDLSDELKERYKTKWEIKQRAVIDLAADRGKFIDQSQSMNIAMPTPNSAKLTSCHFHAWKKGLKTGMYYLHTRPAAEADKFSLSSSGSGGDDCLMCSA